MTSHLNQNYLSVLDLQVILKDVSKDIDETTNGLNEVITEASSPFHTLTVSAFKSKLSRLDQVKHDLDNVLSLLPNAFILINSSYFKEHVELYYYPDKANSNATLDEIIELRREEYDQINIAGNIYYLYKPT